MGAGLSLSFYDNLVPYGHRQYHRVVQVRKKMESLNPRKIDQRGCVADHCHIRPKRFSVSRSFSYASTS
ncbi:hypothetical protein GGQ17_001294 [Salinibacter ruber]|nr:hypothetical protein [Salinibacter ruber]